MDKSTKRAILLITYAVCLFVVVNNFVFFVSLLLKALSLCFPVVVALLLALILNVPMRGFEKLFDKISQKSKKPISSKVKYGVSLFLSILSILLVLVIVFSILVPRLTESIKSLIVTIDSKIPEFLIWLESLGVDTTTITSKLAEFDLNEVVKQITHGAFTIVETAFDATVVAVKYLSMSILSIIIAVYLLLDKENLSRQAKKMCFSFLPNKVAEGIYSTAYLIRDTFSKFLSGQCLEALILAALIFLLFSLFGLPYASLIAFLAAVLSFIPYVGSFFACVVGVFLTLVVSPHKALICLIVYLVAQFIEQHFIYPHVVGNSVGLSPFYTIVAVLIGGNLFGIFGMIFFIPLFSVIYVLIKGYMTNRANKKITTNSKQ